MQIKDEIWGGKGNYHSSWCLQCCRGNSQSTDRLQRTECAIYASELLLFHI